MGFNDFAVSVKHIEYDLSKPENIIESLSEDLRSQHDLSYIFTNVAITIDNCGQQSEINQLELYLETRGDFEELREAITENRGLKVKSDTFKLKYDATEQTLIFELIPSEIRDPSFRFKFIQPEQIFIFVDAFLDYFQQVENVLGMIAQNKV
jgi:hypothetical protein